MKNDNTIKIYENVKKQIIAGKLQKIRQVNTFKQRKEHNNANLRAVKGVTP